jgi:hypothetical protein
VEEASLLESLVGQVVVLDLTSPYVIIGTYRGVDGVHYVVEESDIHDLRDTTTTRDLYVLDAKRHGVNCNRRRTFVRCDGVVSISRLDDVVE